MNRRSWHARAAPLAVGLAAALALGLAACGDDGPHGDASPTRLQEALAGLGSGVSPTGTGFGWADLDALRGRAPGLGLAADALGPGADDLLDERRAIRVATGLRPGGASQALSIQGSYALGVRFEGLEPGRLAALLRSAGASERRDGPWALYDLGRRAESEPRGPLRPFGALISRVAIGPGAAAGGGALVVSRFEGARASLTGAGGELDLAGTRVEAAAECLGEVAAARLVPGTFTHDVPESPRLIGFGVRDPAGAAPPDEVLCAIEDTEQAAGRRADALRRTFAEGATDAVTGEQVAGLAEIEEVGTERAGDHFAARVVLRRVEGSRPGLLFDAFVRGSLLAYLGGERPIPSARAP